MVPEPILGRGQREKHVYTRLKDYVTHTISLGPSINSPIRSKSLGTPYLVAHYVNCENFSLQHRNFLTGITTGHEPATFAEAVKDEGWRRTMQIEVDALEKNNTWTVETLPPGKKAIESKWVYKIKYNFNGSIERLKARLVIIGKNQVEGIDYHESFALIEKMVTVHVFLAANN